VMLQSRSVSQEVQEWIAPHYETCNVTIQRYTRPTRHDKMVNPLSHELALIYLCTATLGGKPTKDGGKVGGSFVLQPYHNA
jgi:hypothetical protein